MLRKLVSGLVVMPLFVSVLMLAVNIRLVKADWTWTETIYIRADGSVEPETAPISSTDNVTYTLTDNIVGDVPTGFSAIVVERDNIVVDGAHYTVQGTRANDSKGIDLTGRSNVTIMNMEIRSFDDGIVFYRSVNNTISGNNITTHSSGKRALHLTSSSHNSIYDNNIRGGMVEEEVWGIGIELESSPNNTISRNNIVSNFQAITLDDCSNNSISGNKVSSNFRAIDLHNSSNNSISGNKVSSNHNGIWLASSSYNSISGNNIADNGMGYGFPAIELYDSSYNIISENTIMSNAYGIQLFISSSYNSISGNNIAGNYWGVCLSGSSNNIFSANEITANGNYGIMLWESSDNTFFGNDIRANNDCGMELVGSSNNVVCHNNFVDNTPQQVHIEEPGGVNSWDNDYPSGGNYWSDYTGVDAHQGSNQNILGRDGIGDTPYMIAAHNQDNYPLRNPWTPTKTNVKVNGKDHPVTVVSNTTIDQIVTTSNQLRFRSSGPVGESGYILAIFPVVNTTEIKVFIDDQQLTPPPFPVMNANETHYFIYFEFTLSTHDITLQFAPAEWVIPKWLLAFLFLLAVLLGTNLVVTVGFVLWSLHKREGKTNLGKHRSVLRKCYFLLEPLGH